MLKFIKYVFATAVGMIVGFFLIIFLLVALTIGLATTLTDDTTEVKPNSILVLNFNSAIEEMVSDNPLDNIDYESFSREHKLGLHNIVEAILTAKNDDNIKGIFIRATDIDAGITTIDEIRNALIRFKESGKFIIAFEESYSQATYYLASVADRIYLKPEGSVEFKGLALQTIFYKDALEKLGLEMQILRSGKYKSAVEPYFTDHMSDESRYQMQVYIDYVWKYILNGISAYRLVSENELNRIAEEMLINSAESAVKYGLVDECKYFDEVLDELKDSVGCEQSKNINQVSIAQYIPYCETNKLIPETQDQIAVVVAAGDIVSGEGEEGEMGGEKIARTLRSVRRDENVKAVVFRINSGGGSALASESIWREVELITKEKPCIVSMGDMAASGGYYIACPASVVIANPTTITGSIGVFGVMPCAEKLLDKIGVATDLVKTNSFSDIGTITRPLKDKEREVVGSEIDDCYSTFIGHVADGRNMSRDSVHAIAQGRVWVGDDAQKIGLVDMMGDMQAAINVAADVAKLESFQLKYLPEPEDPFTLIMQTISDESDVHIKEFLGEAYTYIRGAKNFEQKTGVQARLPFDIIIK